MISHLLYSLVLSVYHCFFSIIVVVDHTFLISMFACISREGIQSWWWVEPRSESVIVSLCHDGCSCDFTGGERTTHDAKEASYKGMGALMESNPCLTSQMFG